MGSEQKEIYYLSGENRAALERNRQSLAEARGRISGAVRSMSTTGLPMRPTLNLREETGAFGTRVLKPRATGESVEMDTRARVACGQALLQASGTMASGSPGPGLIASLKEAAFLSRQAGVAATDGDLAVSCPADTGAGERLADAGPDELAVAREAVRRQADVFAALYDHVSGNMERMLDLRAAAKDSAEALKQAEQSRDAAQAAFEKLQAEQPAPAPADPSAAPISPDDEKRRALEEAMKALRESETVLGEIEGLHQQNIDGLTKAETDLNQMQDLMGRMGSDPEAMPSLRQALGLPEDAAHKPKG